MEQLSQGSPYQFVKSVEVVCLYVGFWTGIGKLRRVNSLRRGFPHA